MEKLVETYYIGAYWASRKEKLDQVAPKVLSTLQQLSRIDPVFGNWYEQGYSRKAALKKKVAFDIESITGLCRKSAKKGEFDETGYARMGFSVGLWTGQGEEEASNISISAGKEFKRNLLSNVCVVNLPYKEDLLQPFLSGPKGREVVNAFVEIWNPDHAVLTSHVFSDRFKTHNEIGLVTYRRKLKLWRKPRLKGSVIRYEKRENGHWFYGEANDFSERIVQSLLAIF